MRECEAFRDQLQSLREQFAGQEVLTLDQSSKLLGLDRAALLGDKDFPAKKVGKKYIIPIVPLARWMAITTCARNLPECSASCAGSPSLRAT